MAKQLTFDELDDLLDVLHEDGVSVKKLFALRNDLLSNDPTALTRLVQLANERGFGHVFGPRDSANQ